MKTMSVACAIAAVALCGCSTFNKEDVRLFSTGLKARETGICNVHHRPMQKKTVPIVYGLIEEDRSAPSYRERARRFPHAEEWIAGGCMIGPESNSQIYVCPECKEAERKWIRQHPFSRWARAQLRYAES